MRTLKMYRGSINDLMLDRAVKALRDGEIIIYPTDTTYAIGCDALNNRSIERICRLKGINPAKQRLSILCSDLSQASEYVRIDNYAFRVLKANLPGPFTFILPASPTLPKVFKGRHEAGVRIPDCDIATGLAARLGNPLLTTSISWEAELPDDGSDPMCIAHNYASSVDLMIDAGEGGLYPSAIIDLIDSRSPSIIREGHVDPIL